MSADQTDYDKIVKDHLRMRLMESGWTNQLSQLIKNAIGKRIEGGQTPNTIKFEQLYGDVIDPARDAVTNEMEIEFHQKIGEYLSLNLNETGKTPSTYTPHRDPRRRTMSHNSHVFQDPSKVPPSNPPDIHSNGLTEVSFVDPLKFSSHNPSQVPAHEFSVVPSVIPADVLSNDYTGMEPSCSYH